MGIGESNRRRDPRGSSEGDVERRRRQAIVLAEVTSLHPRSVAKTLVLVVSFITLASLFGQFCKHVLGYDYMMGFVPFGTATV